MSLIQVRILSLPLWAQVTVDIPGISRHKMLNIKNSFKDIVAMAPSDAFLQRLKVLEFSKEQ